LRNHGDGGGDGLDSRFLYGLEHGFVYRSIGEHFPVVAVIAEVVGSFDAALGESFATSTFASTSIDA